jgi:predicted aldo/keto reductase-like oxidoreductase
VKLHSRTTRREFLKTAALAGVLATPAGAFARGEDQPGDSEIVYRTLGRTGIKLPIVSMGSCYAVDLVQAAYGRGVRYFHSSGGYAEGEHERLLGRALRPFPRDTYVIGTSADLPYRTPRGGGPSLDVGTAVDPKLIGRSLDDSLKRLKLEYVDVYFFASVARKESVVHEPYLEALAKLKQSGKARFVGIATHSSEPAVIRAAAGCGFWDVVLTAFNFRQSHREDVRKAIVEAADGGVGIMAMKTQAGVYWDRSRKKMINMKAALKWALRDKNVHTAIPAFTNFREMQEDLRVMHNPALTSEEMGDLGLGDEMGWSGNYCQQCGTCLPQCPEGVDIPLLMRSHMYALAHRQPAKARRTLSGWSVEDVSCVECARCRVHCALGLDVRSRAVDVTRLLDVPGDLLG